MANNLFNLTNPDFRGIMVGFVVNLVFLFLLVRVVYYRFNKNGMFLFTFFLMSFMIYFIAAMIRAVVIELSMGIGLFAVFTILRLRTRNFSVKDMAYMFTVIGLSVINSLKLVAFPLLGLVIINAIIILSAFIMEEVLLKNKSESHLIIYENLELLNSDKKQKLLNDLSNISGKEVLRFKIIRVNYRRKIARLEIFYKA